MPQVVIEDPLLNSPFSEPVRLFVFIYEGDSTPENRSKRDASWDQSNALEIDGTAITRNLIVKL